MIDDFLGRIRGHRSYRDYVRNGRVWKEVLKGKTLRQVLSGDIERYVAGRRGAVKEATINRELAFIKRVFNVAMADGYVDSNPAQRVKLLKENNVRRRFLTTEEEVRLRAAIGEEHWPVVSLALNTGLRRSEQFNLRWENVDFDTGIITVPLTKNGETRVLPMNDTARELLRHLPSRLKSVWVFPSKTANTPLGGQNFINRVFLPAISRTRIENFHWHDLRHTFASRLAMAGVPLRTIQKFMGHKSIQMTERYSHLSDEHELDAIPALEQIPN